MSTSVRSLLANLTLSREQWVETSRPLAERAVVDWFAAAIGGSGSAGARALTSAYEPLAGLSRLVGRPDRTSAPVAALVNGFAAHVTEMDDIYAPGTYHPGAPTVAAALAVADHVDASGPDLLDAVSVGYEVGCRLAEDLGPEHYRHWHTTGTVGVVGSAAAAARLLGLTHAATMDALGLAATMSAGLQQTFRSEASSKPLHSGHAAQSGVLAAFGAAGQLASSDDVFEGAAGLAVATGAETDWAAVRAGATGLPAIGRITVKPYPCCGHAFAPIDAALALRSSGVRLEDVLRITVETYAAAIDVAGDPTPNSPATRRFSIPFAVLSALTDGTPSAATFEQPLVTSCPVDLAVDSGYQAEFPHLRGARVRVHLVSGGEAVAEIADRKGSPSDPLSETEVENKLRAALGPARSAPACALINSIRRLRHGGPVAALTVNP